MKKCPFCAEEIQDEAIVCKHCGRDLQPQKKTKKGAGLGGGCLAVIVLFVGLIAIGMCNSPSDRGSSRPPRETAANDDAQLLFSRCGTPDVDDSTAYDRPRPPIPSRIVEYRRVGLRIAFVPGYGAKIGDPPPYRWRLLGVIDIKRNEAITLAEAMQRMPCWSR